MPKVVTAVQELPGKGIYAVYVDGEHAFDLEPEAYLRLGVSEGEALDEERLEQLRREAALGRAKARALRLLTARARTERELVLRLEREGFEPEAVAGAVDWLRSFGYLDDEAFAREWVESRGRSMRVGARRLALELRRRGVPSEVARRASASVSKAEEEEWARELAAKRLSRLAGLPRDKAARRIGAYLERRGFDPEVIERVVSQLWE